MPSAQEIKKQIRASLGLPQKPESHPTVPIEGHICDFPLWSYSRRRSSVTRLHIDYDDNSFVTIKAPEGMPSSLSEKSLGSTIVHLSAYAAASD